MNPSPFERARQLIAEGTVTLEALDDLRAQLLETILPDGTPLAQAELGDGGEEKLLIDVLTCLFVVDRHDPAHPWSLATALYAMGRYYEAALGFFEAASRFGWSATTAPLTNDEHDWATASLEHAAECFERCQLRLSSAALRNVDSSPRGQP